MSSDVSWHTRDKLRPEGLLGRIAQDGHLNSHTAPELWKEVEENSWKRMKQEMHSWFSHWKLWQLPHVQDELRARWQKLSNTVYKVAVKSIDIILGSFNVLAAMLAAILICQIAQGCHFAQVGSVMSTCNMRHEMLQNHWKATGGISFGLDQK